MLINFLLARKKAIFALAGLLATWLPIALSAPRITYVMWAALGSGILGVLGVHEATNVQGVLSSAAAKADAAGLSVRDIEKLVEAAAVKAISTASSNLTAFPLMGNEGTLTVTTGPSTNTAPSPVTSVNPSTFINPPTAIE